MFPHAKLKFSQSPFQCHLLSNCIFTWKGIGGTSSLVATDQAVCAVRCTVSQIYLIKYSYMFRTGPLSTIRSISTLYTQQ